MAKLAIDGGPKTRKKPWPPRNKRFGREELKHLKEALDQNTLFYMYGTKTKKMCAKMARMCGTKYAVPCSSGSAAIHGAVKASGVGPGDEVITSPITDAGTILSIVYEGAIPTFADIDPLTYNMTPQSVEQRITRKTKAVIVVHLAGSPADIKPMVRLCRKRKIAVIEDCAQSWGAKVNGRWVGTFGDFGCFSLNDFKHITTGDGGIIVTNSAKGYRNAWLSVDKCYDRPKGKRSLPFAAPNYRISELQSAVGIAQLGRVKKITSVRHRLGERLSRGLRKIDGIQPHGVIKGGYCTYWFYMMRIDPAAFRASGTKFVSAINAEGIPAGSGYVDPVYLQYEYLRNKTAFHHSRWPFSQAKGKLPYRKGYCPNAESAFKSCMTLGLNESWSEREIDDTLAATRKVAAHYAR